MAAGSPTYARLRAPVQADGARPAADRSRRGVGDGLAVRTLSASYGRLEGVRFLFGSIANLATGAVVGAEVLAHPRYPGFADVLAAGSRGEQRTAFDAGMAAAGLRWSLDAGVRLPIHLNLAAETVAAPKQVLGELHTAVVELGGEPDQVVIEIAAPTEDPNRVLAGAQRLRERGYRLLIDQAYTDEMSWSLVTRLKPDQVKLHPELVAELGRGAAGADTRAIARLMRRCQDQGAEVVADGITTRAELDALRSCGVRRGQGPLLAAPSRRPLTQLNLAAPAQSPIEVARALTTHTERATIGGFARAATVAADCATGDEVRQIFRDAPTITSVVLVDSTRRPVATVDRNRFMLAVSGPYGHALHSQRPAQALGDPPRTLAASADPRDAMALLDTGDPQRRYDDIVVADDQGRCSGIAHVADVLHGVAELEYQRALALHPVTRYPGVEALDRFLERRLTGETDFAAGWLVPQLGPVIGRGGFADADAALRRLAYAVATATGRTPGTEVTHVLEGLVVLTGPDRVAALDDAVRQVLNQHGGAGLYSVWLTCRPGQLSAPAEVESHLARLMERARTMGVDTAVTATPNSTGQPRSLEPFWTAPPRTAVAGR